MLIEGFIGSISVIFKERSFKMFLIYIFGDPFFFFFFFWKSGTICEMSVGSIFE